MDAPKNGNAEASRPVGIGWAAALALAIAVGVSRVVPHPWNIPPVAGLCLFLGARQRSWFAFALPLALMFVTDLILIIPYGAIGMASLQTITLFVYASVLLDVAIGLADARGLRGGRAVLCDHQLRLVADRRLSPDAGGTGRLLRDGLAILEELNHRWPGRILVVPGRP
jgi:hypothetical protein